MDKDKVKGTIDDTVGRAKRQAGEWTGDTKTQAEGAAQQIKGKAEKAWGNVKETVRDTQTDADRERKQKAEADHEAAHAGSGTRNSDSHR
jgi:uncharacterized protein YjbJ (UPF0337 family)